MSATIDYNDLLDKLKVATHISVVTNPAGKSRDTWARWERRPITSLSVSYEEDNEHVKIGFDTESGIRKKLYLPLRSNRGVKVYYNNDPTLVYGCGRRHSTSSGRDGVGYLVNKQIN